MRHPHVIWRPDRAWSTRILCAGLLVVAGVLGSGSAPAAELRALPAGQLPQDVRLGPLRDLDGYFPFASPVADGAPRDAWDTRAAQLRRQMLVSLGLWPLPSRTPLEAVIHGRVELGDYTVDKVYFQSMPNFFVTGNLYRPVGKSGPLPGVLCPHGHWPNGRFYDCGRDAVRRQIVHGAERFEEGGRNPLQARCMQLARMGCVVFHWDMIGYADSQQIPSEIIHGFSTQRPDMNRAEGWGLFSPQAEAWLQSAMGLQTWNAMRALDFLTSLPDIDPQRIAVTGASGGGTQTFILAALDPRVQVAFPAVMVSTAMQGGCTCENACGLRIGTGNIEFAALFAPKPLGMTGANDWTKEMATRGYPELQRHFAALGAADRVGLFPLLHFDHNYNYVSRAAMYSWFNQHLQLGWEEPVVEDEYHRLAAEELTVWDDQHPRPAGGPEFERQLLAWWHADTVASLQALRPRDGESLQKYQEIVGGGVRSILRPDEIAADTLQWQLVSHEENAGYARILGLLTRPLTAREKIGFAPAADLHAAQEQLPVLLLRPRSWHGRACLVVTPGGKQALLQDQGQPSPAVQRLLDAGVAVCGVDLLYQGEFLEPGQTYDRTRSVPNPREAAAYTLGYNPALFAQRVHDLVTVVTFLRRGAYQIEDVDLLAYSGAGHWAAAARAQLGASIGRLALDTAGFRFAQVTDIRHPDFLPGGARYDDLPGMLAVAAPAPVLVAGEQPALPEPMTAAYAAAGTPDAAQVCAATGEEFVAAAVNWLTSQ
jgi:dienelactone hydrolase